MSSTCPNGPRTECWQPLADKLAPLKQQVTGPQREELLSAYWELAGSAQFVGDFKESKMFYDNALEMVDGLAPAANGESEGEFLHAMIRYDEAILALGMHDYAGALREFDDFSSLAKSRGWSASASTAFFRAAALIGLGRTAEADQLLEALLQGLSFDGESPWEAPPFGPQPFNPYGAGRRIAAHYMHEHRFDKALNLLHKLETERQATLAKMPKEPIRGGYWAQWTSQADLLDDEAAVYVMMRKDDEAERSLTASLALREAEQDQALRNTLQKLALLEKRKGDNARADSLTRRAAAIKTGPRFADPLQDTLGFASSTSAGGIDVP
ncbi:MAG TPA: hypothetical protein VF472_16155 [Burkholderiaceae bacterium]